MNTLDAAIEGYNNEKYFIITEKIDSWHNKHNAEVYEAYIERVKQIDECILKLLTLKYYPNS